MLNTIRTAVHLKPVQVLNRLYRVTKTVKLRQFDFEGRRTLRHEWMQPAEHHSSPLSDTGVSLLNIDAPWPDKLLWNDPSKTKLWLYNLHYHDGLGCSATEDTLKDRLIGAWIADNPAMSGVGWEPYPLSLRVVNWIKFLVAGNDGPAGMDESLFDQLHALFQQIEYHLLGNHLFANAKALVFGGLFFEGPHAAKWLAKGLKILAQQVPEQFLEDGGHFELSTTYHATLSEDLLDLINILRTYGHPGEADRLVPVAWKSIEWLTVMTRPDGLPPLFNDAAYATSPTLVALQDYAERLGLPVPKARPDALSELSHSGYFRYDARGYSIWCDAGQIGPDYIPGHAHCDMMNFELFAHGNPIIVDPGVSTYEVCERRLIERATKSHNTVQFAELEQSEIWAAFRVARRARIVDRQVSTHSLSARMVNYNRAYLHRRKFSFSETSILIEDMVEAKKVATATARFHFHPQVGLKQNGQELVADKLVLSFKGASSISLASYTYAPEFNKTLQAQCVEVVFDRELETHITL